MQHPCHTRINYYFYFLNITKLDYIHLMSVYYFKIKKVILIVILINLSNSAGEGILRAVAVGAGITHALCPSSCREFWDVSLPFYCYSSSVVFSLLITILK